MFKNYFKLLKYELLNIVRNRWLFGYCLFIFGLTAVLIRIAGDFNKAAASLGLFSIVVVPLTASMFTGLYWYYSDRFTQLLLTQPMSRVILYFARLSALTVSLTLSYGLGTLAGFLVYGHWSADVFTLIGISSLLCFVFIALSFLVSILINDRMRGIGVVFGIWIYFVLIHDGILLLSLLALKDSPMDIPGGILGSFSPMGLSRVILLMNFEAPMLLGHTGALVRNILTSWQGYALAAGVSALWILFPATGGYLSFKRKDF